MRVELSCRSRRFVGQFSGSSVGAGRVKQETVATAGAGIQVLEAEDDLPGIKQVSASYQKGQMLVEYDETQVSEAQIVAAVKARGYQAFLAVSS